MYCYSLVHQFCEFIHGDWANFNVRFVAIDVIVLLQDAYANAYEYAYAYTENQSTAGIQDEHDPPCFQVYRTTGNVDQSYGRKTRLENDGKKLSSRNENCLILTPPPVEELIFTKEDIWSSGDVTPSQPQTRLPVYSENGINRIISGEHRDLRYWVSCSAISFSQGRDYNIQPIRKDIATRRQRGRRERSKKHWLPNTSCKSCNAISSRCHFSTLSLVNAQNQSQF